MKKFYITTAIDYVNSLPHIGTAYEKITADCIARAKRLLGYDVRFCMGTDEHSVNVKKKAIEEGLHPLAFCDKMVPRFEEIWGKLSISYDDFIRTTQERHKVSVRVLFERINDAGDIYTSDYKGWYCEGCELFIQEKDLVDGRCPNHKKEPSWIEEQNYFFRLSNYRDRLLDHIKENPDFIQPETRRNEIVKLIEGGLEDISVSRSGFDWGIPLPVDPDHVVYVWFDALINYISSLGFGGEENADFEHYWPADLQIIGKDITRFHCVIWPAMLMSAGVEPPKSVFGHGFIYHRGEKMSKSLGNVVSPLDIVDMYGADPLRYFLLREVVYGQDGDFTYDRFIDRYNSDLANDLGNLVSRTISMIYKYLDGMIPELAVPGNDNLANEFPAVAQKWKEAIERYKLSIACEAVWEYIRKANRLIEESAPWKLAKDPGKRDELVSILYDLASVISGIALLLYPYIPASSEKIWKVFGWSEKISNGKLKDTSSRINAPTGVNIEKIEALFPRIEKVSEEETTMPDTPQPSPLSPETETGTDTATIDDFVKLDIRIGTVTKAEKVENSNKLLRLKIDDGMGGRTILAGLARDFTPEDITGKQVAFLANLKPRKMMGELSQGMVLSAGDEGKLSLLTTNVEVAPGSKVS
ncbi:methionine--tRNA ligase [Candidatus Latescibacterota bacterium]